MLHQFDNYSYDDVHRELRHGTELLRVDPQLLDLLALFLRHPGELLSRQQITDSVWEGRAIGDSVLSVAIARLRKFLGRPPDNRHYIESRYGRGYRFVCDVKQTPSPRARSLESAVLSPLVGRADALAQLHSAAAKAQAGAGRLCLITGEAGIGKTRLAESLEQDAQEESALRVLWVRCRAEGSPPLWPIRQVVRELAKYDHEGDPPFNTTELAADEPTRSVDAASAQLFEILAQGASIDQGALDFIAQHILQACIRHPLLLVIDDIQWADSASLRVLAYLSDGIVRAPLLLVCTYRNGSALGGALRDVSRLSNHRNCQRIQLQRLSAAEVTQYVHACFGAERTNREELSGVLFARSEGNPFFMVDLLRALESGPFSADRPLCPSSFALNTVRERLQDLPDATRRVLGAAAVIGHDFDIGLLSHLASAPPEEILDQLTAPVVNHTVRAVFGAAGQFAFDHELIREVLYNELSPQERGQLHLRAGQGLQDRRTNGGDVTTAQLAHHFLSAQPFGDIEVAVAYAQAAAAESARVAAHGDVRATLERALDVLRFRIAPRPELRARLLLQLALIERVQGDPGYGAHLATAVSIAREHRLGQLLTFAGQLLSVGPDLVAHPHAASVLEAAKETLDANDHENLAIVHAHLSWTPPNCQSAQRVDELLSRAQALANMSGSANARAAVDDALLFFSAGPEALVQAEDIAHAIELRCDAQPELASQARRVLVARFRLITAMQRGDKAGVTRAIEARAALVSQLRNAEVRWHHDRMLLVNAMNEGAFWRIKSELIALRERARRLELHASELIWKLDYGVFLCRTSDVSSIAARVRPALRPSELDSPQIRAGKIRSLVDFGLRDEVIQAMSQISLDEVADLPRDRDYLAVLCHLAAGAAAARNIEHCEMLIRLLGPYADFYAVGFSFHCDGSISSHLGLLYEALGHLKCARDHYAHGREREQRFGLLPCAAMTGLRLARILLSGTVDHNGGPQLLAHVCDEAERMGMRPLWRAANDLLTSYAPDGAAATCAAAPFTQRVRAHHNEMLDDH